MKKLCQIFHEKTIKIYAFVLVLCLIWGLAPAAEGVSVKLRGKIALAGILSGLAYVTHALVTRDRRIVEKLRHQLGPPERVIQFERGFDLWRMDYYGEQCYMFRNNRFVGEKPLKTSLCVYDTPPDSTVWLEGWKAGRLKARRKGWKYGRKKHSSIPPSLHFSVFPPFLIDTFVLVPPKWLRLCPLHPQRVPQLVSSYLDRLADERLLDPEPWLSH